MAGYSRQSAASIVPTAVVRATPLNDEFNTLRDAFVVASGHKHDGTATEGAYIPLISDPNARNKLAVDTGNNRLGVFVNVSSSSVEQVRFIDGAFIPVTDNDIDLGSSTFEFKDLYIDGTANIDSLNADAATILSGTIDNTSVGATTPSTGAFTTLSATGQFTSTVSTGTAPFVVASTTKVNNLNADQLDGGDWATPGAIGSSVANSGAFTTLSASSTTTLSSLTASTALALNASNQIVSVTNTGSGNNVLATSPVLTTPNLGTPSAVTLTNATGLPLTTGVTGTLPVANGGTGITSFGTGVATALGQNVSGSGSIALTNSPTFTTPSLGTPSAVTLTNATGLPLTTGVTGTLPVANGGTGVTTSTGTGAVVLSNSPALTTPNLGTPSAATLTNATGLPISTGVSGLGTGVSSALATNTGSSGAFVVNGGALGTPSSGTLTNATGLPLSTGVTGTLPISNGGTGVTAAASNGQLLIGNGTGFTLATLTAGSNVTITNSSGGIIIGATGGGGGGGGSNAFSWFIA